MWTESGQIEFDEFVYLMSSYCGDDNKDEQEEQLMAAFRMFDKDRSGKITADELKSVMHK